MQQSLLVDRQHEIGGNNVLVRVFKTPGPLHGGHVDIQRLWVGAHGLGQGFSSQVGEVQNRDQRGEGPNHLQAWIPLDVGTVRIVAAFPPKNHDAVDHENNDQGEEKGDDLKLQVKQVVNGLGLGAGLHRQQARVVQPDEQ
jgi:hypothetical protein